ncbi:hypothetical protein VP1G_06440 [Cytospora mali]|uniref:Uncharacterized protein n=1 Tax=Cytospora mali TaxID=578113 RepID=A0A194V5K8_CYTMA|nr:hypothetical protein VP1G_06440 [Valsa mali var. pyri (nom. inval.)]
MPPNTQGMPMQPGQQRPMNPVMMNNMGQPGAQMGPFGNMESIVNEQKQGFMAEQAGQLVVPASSGQGRNATPQPLGGMQPQNAFPQGPNQTPRPQMPNGLDPQQQDRLRQMQASHAHAQAQAQLRAQAAAKGLQGQPGGLSGPMPASQSPAMDNLNAPVRQPPVAMGQMGGNQAAAGNPQFGQGLDPRFNQPGAPGPMHGNLNGPLDPALRAMLSQLSPEQQQRFRQLPPDKLNEILVKLKRGGVQGRPGQPQPGMPMNPGTPGNPMGVPMQQPNGGMNPQMQQIMQQQQLNRMRAASNPLQHPQAQMIMENMDVPPQVTQRMPGIPPEVKKWHQFKAWIQQTNTALPDQMKQSLKHVQLQQYRRLMGGNMGPGPGPQPGAPRPNPLANLPPNVQLPEVTAQEIQNFRMTQEKFRETPDEQIRAFIQRIKIQRQVQAANQGHGAPQPSGQPAAPVTTQPGIPPAVTGTPQGFPQGHSIPVPASAPAPEPSQNASAVAPGPKANRPPQQQNMPAPPNPSPAAAPKNLKRPSTDDLEATTQQNANNQRPLSQPGQVPSGRPLPIIPPDQLAKMPPVQRQRTILQEEKQAFDAQKFPDLPLSADTKAQIMPVISKAIEEFTKISKILRQWFTRTRDDGRLRAFIKARLRLVSQFHDGEQAQVLKDKLTMTMAEVVQSRHLLESIVKDLSASNTGRPPQLGGPVADQEPPQQNQPGPKLAPTPLNEANLAKQTQALNKMHQRSNSRGGQPPAAPTTAQPPFPFGAASPDGKPLWAAPTPLTQDNLQIPAARKKIKTNAQTSSPVVPSLNASPQTKAASPELKRQEPKAAPSKPAFMCMEPGCDMAGSGFPTEEARRQHHQEVHVLPYQHPQQFLEQSMAAAFGLDEHGLLNTQTKPEGATPMSREASMRRQGSVSGGSATQAANTDDKTAPGSKPADKNTPGQAATLPQQPQVVADPLANTTIDPQSLMAPVLNIFDSSAGGVISDMSLYRSTTPNEDTPNSSASKESGVSEPNSDIPETANLEIDMNWANYDGSTLVNGMAAFGMDMDLNSFGAMADDDMHITEDMLADMDKPFTSLDSSLYGLDAL